MYLKLRRIVIQIEEVHQDFEIINLFSELLTLLFSEVNLSEIRSLGIKILKTILISESLIKSNI